MEEKQRYVQEDEITLKELILKLKEYFWEVVQNWKWVLIITIPLIVFFLYQAITTPIEYHAELTFMVNEDDGGGIGGVSAILGQIGLGGGRRGKNNLDKILALAKSRNIVQRVVFDSIIIEGKEDFLGNHIIRLYDFHKEWKDDTTGLKDFMFIKDDLSNRVERRVLKSLYSKIIGGENIEGIFNTKFNEDTGIMEFSTQTVREELSIGLCKILYEYLAEFYVTRTVEKQQQTFDVMLQKVDSVKAVMAAKEYQLANFLDQNRGLYTAKAKRRELELQRDVRLLNEMYAVTLKNFEIADFSLKNKTPFIQLIDEPIGPLTGVVKSKVKSLILGMGLGVIFATILILGRKILKDTMATTIS